MADEFQTRIDQFGNVRVDARETLTMDLPNSIMEHTNSGAFIETSRAFTKPNYEPIQITIAGPKIFSNTDL